jgi:hypothetical protein
MPSFIGYPRDIEFGQGVGMIATRVIEPVTPLERELVNAMRAASGFGMRPAPVWRVVLWFGGKVFFISEVLVEAPTLADSLDDYRAHPLSWAEVVRAPAPPAP